MVFPDTRDADAGRSLLEREESALARKRQAINTGAKSLEALRRASADSRDALQRLRNLEFSQREITDAFGLTREEVTQLFPRRPRSAAAASGADPAVDIAVDAAADTAGQAQESASAGGSAGGSGPAGPGAREHLGTAVNDDTQHPGQQPQAS